MDLEALGRVLRERREAIGIPRSVVAKRVDVHPSYISMVERATQSGRRRPVQPSRDVLKRWAQALSWGDNYLTVLLGLAGHAEANRPRRRLPVAFGTDAALHYPEPREVEREVLLDEIRGLLRESEGSDGGEDASWDETIGLLRSYISWLRFRLQHSVEDN